MRYAIAYDISDDSNRRKVAECLDSFGDRVQNSVFELVVTRSMLGKCLDRVSALLDSERDRVVVYALCGTCSEKRRYLGCSDGVSGIGEEDVFIV